MHTLTESFCLQLCMSPLFSTVLDVPKSGVSQVQLSKAKHLVSSLKRTESGELLWRVGVQTRMSVSSKHRLSTSPSVFTPAPYSCLLQHFIPQDKPFWFFCGTSCCLFLCLPHFWHFYITTSSTLLKSISTLPATFRFFENVLPPLERDGGDFCLFCSWIYPQCQEQ